ncbi:uncharacterized protein TNCT_505111 [Trichonephila clavata]|uniref:Treslin N-terminal domain-containing protein n=1 Tax=Trichonephila clavata TaxID=2740835 RepID=A0A8X6GGE3_TRICU|nr:uncharacterized protein TNCT_505111 [Trichonephila clavata]
MSFMQIVFLFDLNAFNDELVKSIEELQRKLLCLRLCCLRILTHYSTAVSNLRWGFKFFDSQGSLTQTMCNFSFSNVSLENFETLENEICLKYQRHISYKEALALSSERNETSSSDCNFFANDAETQKTSVKILHLALTQILYEYQWKDSIDMFSPSTRKKVHSNTKKRNMLFLISKCPSSEDEFQKYFGIKYASIKSQNFAQLLLSQSLEEKFLRKASILWIWLNTSENGSFLEIAENILTTLSDSLRSLQCALIPLSVLSKPNCILKLERKLKEQYSELSSFEILYNTLIPFSTSIFQSISYPFYTNRKEASEESELCFTENNFKISVVVTKIPLQWNKKEYRFHQNRILSKRSNAKLLNEKKDNVNTSNHWTRFTVHFMVSRHVHLKPCSILLCLPSVSTKSSSYSSFKVLIKSLFIRNVNLFVVCESASGSMFPGIFTPLSETSAVIYILKPNISFINPSYDTSKSLSVLNISEIKQKLEMETEVFESNNDSKKFFEELNQKSGTLKPFEIESLETWFGPTSSICNILSKTQDQLICDSEIEAFHDKLRLSNKLKKKCKKNTVKDTHKETQEMEVCTEISNDQEDFAELCKDLAYDQIIALLTETYGTAVKSNGSVLHSARKIVKIASLFFMKQSIIKYEENMKNFMTEYFYLNGRKLIEKYGMDQEEEIATKAINECKLQTYLALEMELLFPSTDESNCINFITSVLGVMSFYSGATDLVKFLQENLLENYGNKLYNVLAEIGEELCISLNPDDDSPGHSNDAVSSVSGFDIVSSVASTLSSSNASNKSDGRKLIRKRSDISELNKSRQILLPVKSPKRKKNKTNSATESIPIRYSPRIASKKRRDKTKSIVDDSKSVRRNLFPRDKKLQTPRVSKVLTGTPSKKKKFHTPKRHHVLKTNFVLNTPSHKQNQSALQRRKSQMGFDNENCEIAESPIVSKSAKDKNSFRLLQKLKDYSLPSTSTAPDIIENQEVENKLNHTSIQYTPDTKKRLSLKLFSKLMASPTARMGLKKCSKRLFDQIEPQAYSSPSKKAKLCDQTDNTKNEQSGILSEPDSYSRHQKSP